MYDVHLKARSSEGFGASPSASILTGRLSRRALIRGIGAVGAGLALEAVKPLPTVALSQSRLPAPASSYDASVATTWFDLILQLVKDTPGFSPPVAARAFACAGLSLYEAISPGMQGYRSLAGQVNGLPTIKSARDAAYHWPLVANAALASMVRSLFPHASTEVRVAIDTLEDAVTSGFAPITAPGILKRSVDRGRMVADHIIDWAHSDGGHGGHDTNFPAEYEAPTGPGLWEPTPPAFLPALQPFWGNNRPCVLVTGESCDPGPHPPFSIKPGSAFYEEAIEVFETVNLLTEEQREIALFWADDPVVTSTPPGHSISILNQVLVHEQSTLDHAAEAYAKLGMAVNDAFIACWNAKYRYNLVRPITYINRHIDPGWGHPLPVVTPPFPEYPSGHSVQSGATAEVLSDLFGNDYELTDHTHDDKGFTARTFGSFSEFADEAAISRLYGGIHFQSAIELGLAQGRCVGRAVNSVRFHA